MQSIRKNVTSIVAVIGLAVIVLLSFTDWICVQPRSADGAALAQTRLNLFSFWRMTHLTGFIGVFMTLLIMILIGSLMCLILSLIRRRIKNRKPMVTYSMYMIIFVQLAFLVTFIVTPFKTVSEWVAGAHENLISKIDFTNAFFLLLLLMILLLLLSYLEKRGDYQQYHQFAYHTMIAPAVIFLFIFNLVPITGLVIAFKNYQVARPFFGLTSDWVGLKNFDYIFLKLPDSRQVIINTIIIAVSKIIGFLVVPVLFALLLNESRSRFLKRSIQTTVYLPNFLSWVTVGLLFRQMFSPIGLINTALMGLGILAEPVSFITSNTWFRPIIVFTDIWKGFGYSAVVFIAAISSIDLNLYEAASIDGAGRWKRMRYITVPGILPTIILVGTLSLGNILNAGFDQVFNMITLPVFKTGEIIDTYIYRIAIDGGAYHRGTAMGMAKSVISMLLIMLSYKLADRYAGYRIF